MRKILYILILLASILTSCNGSSSKSHAEGGDTLALKYAKHISIIEHTDYTQVNLTDPWKEGRILHTYYLVPKGKKGDDVAETLKQKGENKQVEASSVVRTPVERSVVFTTVHASLIIELGAAKQITGVCDLNYMNIPWIHQQVKAGAITDCGSGLDADVEKIIDSKPEVLLVSPFENSGGYGKLEEIGIPIVETADYMETSALGRAEWMKFYGMLYGVQKHANALFDKVDSNYHTLKQKAINSKIHRSIITEMKTGGVWYVPGGKSVISEMIKDAGGRYVYAANKDAGSLSYPFEKVLDDAGNADVWIYKYAGHPATLQEIYADYHGYGEMKAWKTAQVYGCDTEKSRYFEEASFHPERVLLDFIIMLHPELRLGYLRYYHKIK